MVNSPSPAATKYRARVITTRPITARGDDHVTVFTSECLHSMARQVREGVVWLNVEHLSFLPPLGRWRDGEVIVCDDGEEELFFSGEGLPHYWAEYVEAARDEFLARLPTNESPALSVELSYDRRNFDRATAEQLESDFDIPTHRRDRWAELPPLEYILTIPVAWGAAKFAGSFLDALGRAAGEGVVAKLRSWAKRSKKPDRSMVLVIEFKISHQSSMRGVVIAPTSEGSCLLERAWENIELLATLAGLQAEQDVLPQMVDSVFFFDGERWRLAWWTDGERVIKTVWFQENPPDTTGLHGD